MKVREGGVVRASVRDNWLAFNAPLEGRLSFMYLDVKGFVTTGVGNLIDASHTSLAAPSASERDAALRVTQALPWRRQDGTPATAEEVAAEWDLVKSRMDLAPRGGAIFASITSLRLADADIDALVFAKLDEMARYLVGRLDFSEFENWPADAQLAILSMSWGMGPAFHFPKFQAAARAGDWETAAAECRFNPDTGSITRRNDLNQQAFHNAAAVIANGDDPGTLVLPK